MQLLISDNKNNIHVVSLKKAATVALVPMIERYTRFVAHMDGRIIYRNEASTASLVSSNRILPSVLENMLAQADEITWDHFIMGLLAK